MSNFKHFYVFGDSITYGAWDAEGGWVQRLRHFVDRKNVSDPDFYCLVYNLGVSGDTSCDVLERFEFELKMRSSDEVVVLFAIGINDSAFLNEKKTNYVPLDEFNVNLQKLVDIAKNFAKKIVWVGLNPVNEELTDPVVWDKSKSYKNEHVRRYNNSVKQVCDNNHLVFVDIFDSMFKDVKKLTFDGLHPNSLGHKNIFSLVKKTVNKESLFC